MKSKNEKVNTDLDPINPAHYKNYRIEVIDALEAWNLNFHRANAIKYIVRAGRKDPDTELQDLQKAKWYLDREIQRVKLGVWEKVEK